MQILIKSLPSINEISNGRAIFSSDMPVWHGKFGDDVWPFIETNSPLYAGKASSSFAWMDYINGLGSTFNHPNSTKKSKYNYCLSEDIVKDLKIAAVIHGYFPNSIKGSKNNNDQLNPKTVKGRIDELARFISFALNYHQTKYGFQLSKLSEISFELLKECIPRFPGRSSHLKRALKLISDPMVQKNLSSPLQWQLLDIYSKSISWRISKDSSRIATLSDTQFLFLMSYCKKVLSEFKNAIGLNLENPEDNNNSDIKKDEVSLYLKALNALYDLSAINKKTNSQTFYKKFGYSRSEVSDLLIDAHCASMMIILLLTGMRSSETVFLMRNCLSTINGFPFLKSKVVKQRPVDTPISEGWLAVDLTIDAYEVLQFITNKTGCQYLFSSPILSYSRKKQTGYSLGSLNSKFSKWLKRIDSNNIFRDWNFSIHQCRETLVYQLARQEVGMPFLSMQLKHFQSQFNRMPNAVTAGYGQYRSQLITSIAKRKAEARENALLEVYGEHAKFAGGGADTHKVRIDTFFSGLGLFGKGREEYIKKMASKGVKLMPTSIGNCTKNFTASRNGEAPPPCYGDYQCDPDCHNHVITRSCTTALELRKEQANKAAINETSLDYKEIWLGLAKRLDAHISKLKSDTIEVNNGK